MEGGGEAPEPSDRGGAALPRRIYLQVPRRQRGYYIGGAGRDDGGYFALAPEQVDGDGGRYFALAPHQVYGDGHRYFDPAPHQVYGDGRRYFDPASHQVYGDGRRYFDPAPHQVYGHGGRYLAPAPQQLYGHDGRYFAPAPQQLYGDGRGYFAHAPQQLYGGGRGYFAHAPEQEYGGFPFPLDRGGAPPPLPQDAIAQAPGSNGDMTRAHGHRGDYTGGAGRDDDGYFAPVLHQDHGSTGGDDRAPEQVYGGAGRVIGEDLAPLAVRIPHHVPHPGGLPGRDANLPLAPEAAPPPLLENALGPNDDMTRARDGPQHGEVDDDMTRDRGGHQHGEVDALGDMGRGGQPIRHLPAGGAGHGQQRHRPRIEAALMEPPLRANRNQQQLINLEKRYRTNNEFANNGNEDLLDLITSMERLKNDIDVAKRADYKYAVKKMSKDYKGALAKAKRYQKAISRAGGVPQPIPPKLL